jgi:hypothetical protein
MAELRICATGDALSVNGESWSVAPQTEALCHAIGSHDLTDGGSVIIDGKPAAKFRYFEKLGIAILESIPESNVGRVVIYMESASRKRKRTSPYKTYGSVSQRPTEKMFCGLLELNGKQLRPPLPFAQFPVMGELVFINQMAFGTNIHVAVAVESGFVEYVLFEFKREKV